MSLREAREHPAPGGGYCSLALVWERAGAKGARQGVRADPEPAPGLGG